MRYYFIIFNVVYSLFASYLIHLSGRSRSEIHEHDKRIIAPFISLISFLLSALLVFYTDQQWLALVFIFAFFLGNIFLPVYLSYGTLVTVLNPEPEEDMPFEEFCKKYEISPRAVSYTHLRAHETPEPLVCRLLLDTKKKTTTTKTNHTFIICYYCVVMKCI